MIEIGPEGGAVFSTKLDTIMHMAMRGGFKLNLEKVRATSIITADREIQKAPGHSITSIFLAHGMISLKADPKLNGLVKRN